MQPIKLPKAFELPKGEATITGWGSVSKNVIPKLPKVLQVAKVAIITEATCLDALKTIAPSENVTDIQFCTGPLDKTIAACIVSTKNIEYFKMSFEKYFFNADIAPCSDDTVMVFYSIFRVILEIL